MWTTHKILTLQTRAETEMHFARRLLSIVVLLLFSSSGIAHEFSQMVFITISIMSTLCRCWPLPIVVSLLHALFTCVVLFLNRTMMQTESYRTKNFELSSRRLEMLCQILRYDCMIILLNTTYTVLNIKEKLIWYEV